MLINVIGCDFWAGRKNRVKSDDGRKDEDE